MDTSEFGLNVQVFPRLVGIGLQVVSDAFCDEVFAVVARLACCVDCCEAVLEGGCYEAGGGILLPGCAVEEGWEGC